MFRRDFFKTLCAAGGAAALLSDPGGSGLADETASNENVPFDEELVVLFSVINFRPEFRTVEAFASRIEALLAMNPQPRHLLIYGDFSQFYGKKEDYLLLREMMRPIEEAGIQWDLAFGNHDRRAAFFEVFPERVQAAPNVPGKYVSIVETPRADFILLDTLVEGEGGGAVDEQQRAWLEKTLAGYSKPVFVGAHHSVKEIGLAQMLADSPAVAGYIFGHHHQWFHTVVDGLPRLTLPSVGYWGDIGFTVLRFVGEEAIFKLRMIDHFADPGKDADIPQQREPEWQKIIREKTGDAFVVPLHRG